MIIINNPFEHFYPDDISPKDTHSLFVKEYTEHNSLTAYKHTMVEGSRGSGKSMLFKFLEPACQKIEYDGWDNFISSTKAFIGVYINCNTGDWKKKEFDELIKPKDVPQIFAEKVIVHEFIMRIAEWTLKTISEQMKDKLQQDEKAFEKIVSALDKKQLYTDATVYPRTLEGLTAIITKERDRVRQSVQTFLERVSLPGNRLEYSGNLAEPSFADGQFLAVFFAEFRQMLRSEKVPFFLLFDEASNSMLWPIQQKIINTFITQRIQNSVCIKVSFRPASYSTDVDLFDKNPQHIHDFDKINLDSLYTNNTQAYYKRILEIANKRLKLAGFKVTDIRSLIPESKSEVEAMEEAKKFTADEYERLPADKKIDDKQNYINKYAKARFFQKFLGKVTYRYTGFDNLVNFSAGITRSFLDPCFEMIEKYMQKYPDTGMKIIKFIPPEIQWDIIRAFSNNFIETEILERIRRRDTDSEERKTLQNLFNLIESLGKYFKIRLQNPNSRYPRIISFSIKETMIDDRDLESVLEKALQECFFQKRWYRGKSGYEMLECYILNRRLCPRYGLDLSGFQGRIELSQDVLKLAMKDKDQFVTWFKSKEKAGEIEAAMQLELFGV